MRRLPLMVAALLLLAPLPVRAQTEVPSLGWKTITTENFRIHFEPGLEAWSQQLASRIEDVRTVVAARVGFTPPRVIDVLVEDPLNQPNGSAWPSLTYPAMRFWATPPSPTSFIGNSRGWGDILAVHEYAHLAHLLRPSRKPFAFPLAVLRVVPLGPLVTGPAWVTEGYATLIEGEVTGSGRPNGAMRPAIIRSLALEGYLPSYDALDASNRFNGGAMRYLVGSAYLEWLQAMRGDSSLPQLWRRASARNDRKFAQAFSATFGDAPDLLYGRFSAEVTRQAFAVRAELEAQGLARGELVQKWSWAVGPPDVSPNGERIAVRRSSPRDPGGIMIFSLEPDTAAIRRDSTAVARRLRKDSLDLPAYQPHPRGLKRVAMLGPVAGASYDAPRFLADGERLLVTRFVPLADGRSRSDLFLWNSRTGKVRRITRGAGILAADPMPDQRSAAALTCGSGSCSVVMVDLERGTLRPLARGTLDGGYAGVRVSRDGRYVATARQQGARWVPVVIEVVSGNARVLGPDDAFSRYSPTWESDTTLITVSEASGVPVLERIPVNNDKMVTVVARTLGAAGSPDVGPDGRIWWLDLHGRGWDLRVNPARTTLPVGSVISDAHFPAARRIAAEKSVTFPAAAVDSARPYGRGPFGFAFVALGTQAGDGGTWSAGAAFGDPLGRGDGLVIGGVGRNGAWSGARADIVWRRFRPALRFHGFSTDYRPSLQPRGAAGFTAADEAYSAAALSLDLTRHGVHGDTRYRAGGSVGHINNPTLNTERVLRRVAFAEMSATYRFTPRSTRRTTVSYAASIASGSTNELTWTRYTADLLVGFQATRGGLNLRVRGGEADVNAPVGERFVFGGTGSPYIDPLVISQRVEHLGLPFGSAGGRRFGVLTAETAGPVRLYHDWIVAGDDAFGETLRVIGGEFAAPVPRVPVMRIPAVRLRVGLSHSLNGALRNATIAYAALTLLP